MTWQVRGRSFGLVGLSGSHTHFCLESEPCLCFFSVDQSLVCKMDFILGKKKDKGEKEKEKAEKSESKEKGDKTTRKDKEVDDLHRQMQNLLISGGKPTMRDFEKIETVGMFPFFSCSLLLLSHFLICILGTGTFGRVWVVKHTSSGHYFALKQMRKKDIVRLKQVEHIANEKNILMSVKHPFIVNMFSEKFL